MSHLGFHTSPALDALIAQYCARACEYRELGARIDAAALCSRFVRELESLRAVSVAVPPLDPVIPDAVKQPMPALAPAPATSNPAVSPINVGAAIATPTAETEERASTDPRQRPRADVAIHRERSAASLRAVEPTPGGRYDANADARSTAALLRASLRRAQ